MIINYEQYRKTFQSDMMIRLGMAQVKRGVKVEFQFDDLQFGINRLYLYFPKALMEVISDHGLRVWARKS